jgi:hypothetical protein
MSVYKIENTGKVCPDGKEMLILYNVHHAFPNKPKGVDDFLYADTMLTLRKCSPPGKFRHLVLKKREFSSRH